MSCDVFFPYRELVFVCNWALVSYWINNYFDGDLVTFLAKYFKYDNVTDTDKLPVLEACLLSGIFIWKLFLHNHHLAG